MGVFLARFVFLLHYIFLQCRQLQCVFIRAVPSTAVTEIKYWSTHCVGCIIHMCNFGIHADLKIYFFKVYDSTFLILCPWKGTSFYRLHVL